MSDIAIRWAARTVALLFGIWLVFAVLTGRWPTALVVHNAVEDARCDLWSFDGFNWTVDLRRGEEKSWFFLFGPPENVRATCTTPAGRRFEDRKAFYCDGRPEGFLTADFTIRGDPESPDAFCIWI